MKKILNEVQKLQKIAGINKVIKEDKYQQDLINQVVKGIEIDYGTTTEEDLEYALHDYLNPSQMSVIDMDMLKQTLIDKGMMN